MHPVQGGGNRSILYGMAVSTWGGVLLFFLKTVSTLGTNCVFGGGVQRKILKTVSTLGTNCVFGGGVQREIEKTLSTKVD